jgi:myo-inositol-1(or 4)-monophosphatase
MTDYLKTCEHAARSGGQVLLDWVGRFAAREKGPADLVTEADLASQEVIREILLSAYPEHGFLGEEGESTGAEKAEYRWLVDPLDGTTNYVHQIPHYCVSIALERRGQLICGTVFDPVSGECFTAVHGGGAHLNGRKIAASAAVDFSQAVAAVSFPPKVQRGSRALNEFNRAVEVFQSIRRTGSTALNLCYLATGRFDAYWGGDTKAWDVAAGALIVQEAGGVITDYTGKSLDLDHPQFAAAATAPLHAKLLDLLAIDSPHG